MTNSITGLFNQLFDNKMESFETAFPARIKSVNGDGTVDIVPSIKNVLKNMQMEPTDSDGNLNAVCDVPILFPGTASAIIEFQLKKGDPVLCIASSRDLRAWIEGGWDSDKPFEPFSFSGNDLNDLVAIPLRMTNRTVPKTKILIGNDGIVTVTTDQIEFNATKLHVSGEIEADGEITTNASGMPIALSTHKHPTAAPGASSTPIP